MKSLKSWSKILKSLNKLAPDNHIPMEFISEQTINKETIPVSKIGERWSYV